MNTCITKSDERTREGGQSSYGISWIRFSSDKVKPPDNGRNDVAPFDHRTYAYVTACKIFRNGTNDLIPDHLFDRPYVLRGQRMLIHERVHGRVNVRRRYRCQRAQERCLFSFIHFFVKEK